MSDQRIRELERAYSEGGDPAVGAKLLHAREQAGQLPRDAFEVLALLQDPAALQLRPAASPFPTSWESLRDWLWTLRLLDAPILSRAIHAWIRRTRSLLLVDGLGEGDPLAAIDNLAATLEDELRDWILSTDCTDPKNEWNALKWREHPFGLSERQGELFALLRLCWLEFCEAPPDFEGHWEDSLLEVCARNGYDRAWVGELSAAIAADLGPWAWGERDPLRALRGVSLEDVRIASPCNVRWEDMAGDARMRTCSSCSRAVFDLSELSEAEARTLLEREGRSVCLQLYRRPDGRVLTRDCLPGLRARLQAYEPMRGMAL